MLWCTTHFHTPKEAGTKEQQSEQQYTQLIDHVQSQQDKQLCQEDESLQECWKLILSVVSSAVITTVRSIMQKHRGRAAPEIPCSALSSWGERRTNFSHS